VLLALAIVLLLAPSGDTLASPRLALDGWVDVVQVTDVAGGSWSSPRISGDGEWVAVQRSPHIYIGRTDGTPLQSFASTAYWSDISADGGKVVAASGGGGDVVLYSGGAVQSIRPCVTGNGAQRCLNAANEAVAISGDGRWLYYISAAQWPCTYADGAWTCTGNLDGSREVWRVHIASGAVTQVSDFNTGAGTGPWWVSTDFSGGRVAFTSGDDSVVHVYSANGAGGDVRQLAEARPSATQYTHRNLTFISGDGEWIVFTGKNAQGRSEVALVRRDGSERRQIIDGYGCDDGPTGSDCSISYDGSIIAVGVLNNETMLLDGHGNALETIPGTQLDLSTDGLRVAFRSTRARLGLGSETDQQVFVMKRGVVKYAPAEALIGSRMSYTVTLRHGDPGSLAASLVDPLPAYSAVVAGSVHATQGTAAYDAGMHRVTWSDALAPGETVTITFAVTPTCTADPPPPATLRNAITATLGGLTLRPMAITTLALPEKDLATLGDAPVDGATDAPIESGGAGPLLRWRDRAAGMVCGATAPADVAYRVYVSREDGDWQEVGSYPNCARQVQLGPDALSCRDNGDPAAYRWKVMALDPQFACREVSESVFSFTTASCRPEIQVEPEFTLAPGYFLDRTDLPNTIRVAVDWNGPAYETPVSSGPYGTVTFELNGAPVERPGLEWGAEHTYDMGADFDAAFSCANNTLHVWASRPVGGGRTIESLKATLQPTVFPFPGWVEWAITSIPGSDAAFGTDPRPPLVAYTYGFNYPEPAFEATWTPPGWIPYLGGHELGIEETQAEAGAEAQSDGAGSAHVAGRTGMGLGALTSEGTLWGQGDARFTCGESLDLERVQMGFSIHATVEKEAGLVDVIPAVKAAENWPVVGRIIHWVNSIATLKAALTPGVEAATVFVDESGQLVFESGEGTAGIDGKATLATEVCDGLSAEAYGGGRPYITIQVPSNPDYLKEVGIDMYYGAGFQAWSFEADYERKISCNYPGACSEVDGAAAALATTGPDWRLIPRDAVRPGYGVVSAPAPIRGVGYAQAAGDGDAEVILIPHAYVRPQPALAVRDDGFRLLTTVHDDPARPQGRGTEIRALTWDGVWSATSITLTGDVQPDYAPAVAFDGDGNALVIWERSALAEGITPTLDIPFARSLEIAARTWFSATSSWGPMHMLTDDGLMDRAPRLASGDDGSVMALWETTDGVDALGTVGHPLTYTWAVWDGGAWSAPSAALTGLTDVMAVDLAVYSATHAALVYMQDMDGVISTTADSELYYSLFDGSGWDAPVRLTDDDVSDAAPSVAFDAEGRLTIAWLSDGDLRALTGSWDTAQSAVVRPDSAEGGALGFTLSRSPSGRLALVWQSMGDDGANLMISVRDAGAAGWGAGRALMDDADVEAGHSPAFADDGALYLAYRKVQTEFVTRTFEIAPSQVYTVTNLPQPGDTQVAFLAHRVGRDLTFDSLAVAPANPAAGDLVTLTAVLRNAGDLPAAAPVVRFTDGAEPIATATLPITLAAGYTATVSTAWTVPTPPAPHTVRAIADPENAVDETDEANNQIWAATTLPDLAIAVLTTSGDGDGVTATARLVNVGALTATAPFSVAFRATDPVTGARLGAADVLVGLPPGGAVTATLRITETGALAGLDDTLWAIADEAGRVVEADVANNRAYGRLAVLPDLALTAADIASGDPVTITVHNRGPVAATEPLLHVRSGGPDGALVYSGTLGVLGPGGSQTVAIATPLDGVELWAYVDPDQAIAEGNEGNNLAVRDVSTAPAANRAPLANAGVDQVVRSGDSVTLDGSGSADPDGDALTYGWTQTGGVPVSFTRGLSVTTFTAPASCGELTFTLTVTDTGGLHDTDTTVVTVDVGRVYVPLVLRNAGL